MNLERYKTFLSDIKSTRKILSEEIQKLKSEIEVNNSKIKILSDSRDIVSLAANVAQESFKEIFERLVTQALQTIFGEEYSFKLESRIHRNQPEMEMFVVENGVRYSPKDEKGGAIIDILSFASRIVSLALRDEKIQNTILLDEPFRCLRKEVLVYLAQLMQDISDELGIQIIYITHEKELAEVSKRPDRDRSFLVQQIEGISRIERLT